MNSNWQFELLTLCFKFNCEPTQDGSKVLIMSPKGLGKTEQDLIRQAIPEEIPIEFKQGPRMSTIMAIKQILAAVGAQGEFRSETSKAEIEITGIDQLHPIWKDVDKIIKRDGFFKSWTLKVEGTEVTYNPEVAKALESHTNVRSHSITKEDISDLGILLNASTSVDDFLKRV